MNSWDGFVEGFSGLSEDFAVTDELSADITRGTLD
jgi:hypothetical protein